MSNFSLPSSIFGGQSMAADLDVGTDDSGNGSTAAQGQVLIVVLNELLHGSVEDSVWCTVAAQLMYRINILVDSQLMYRGGGLVEAHLLYRTGVWEAHF